MLVRFRCIVPRYTIMCRLFCHFPAWFNRNSVSCKPTQGGDGSEVRHRTDSHTFTIESLGRQPFLPLTKSNYLDLGALARFPKGSCWNVFSAVNFRVRHCGDPVCRCGLVLSSGAWPLFRRAWTGDGSAVCPNKTQDVAGDGAGSLAHSRLQFDSLPFCAVRPVRPCFLTSIVSSWKRLLPSLLIIRESLFPAHGDEKSRSMR